MSHARTLVVLAALAALAACGDEKTLQDITAPVPAAAIKFFNFGVGAPGVNFYTNDVKVTAVSSTLCTPLPAPPADSLCVSRGVESTNGVASGGAGAGGFYVGVNPGQVTVSGRIAAAVDNNLPIVSLPVTLGEGKRYSFYISGIYNPTTKQADGFVLEDVFPTQPSADSTYIRFVNAIPNAGPLTLTVINPATGAAVGSIASGVAYRAGSPFVAFSLPRNIVTTLNVAVRNAGSTTNAFERTAISILPRRVYTLTARGDITVSPTGTSANRPQVDVTPNR